MDSRRRDIPAFGTGHTPGAARFLGSFPAHGNSGTARPQVAISQGPVRISGGGSHGKAVGQLTSHARQVFLHVPRVRASERCMTSIARFLALALLPGLPVLAQPTTFEAASVQATDPKSAPVNRPANAQATLRGGPGTADPGRISYANVTLESLLILAYGADCKVQEDCDQIAGPAWLRSNRYDIDAKMPAGTTSEQLRTMLQKLLAERFRMTLHHEIRGLPGYELRPAKSGSKLVSRLPRPNWEPAIPRGRW